MDIDVVPQVEGEVSNLDAPRGAVLFLARLLAAERTLRGTRKGTRALTCYHQAIMVLRHFRDGTDPAASARDHGIGRPTGYRYIDEATAVPADQAPDLHHTLQRAHETGVSPPGTRRHSDPDRPLPGQDDQRQRKEHRLVVLGKGPTPRRQRPRHHGAGRVPPLHQRCRARISE